MKKVIGFITGIILVGGLWLFFSDDLERMMPTQTKVKEHLVEDKSKHSPVVSGSIKIENSIQTKESEGINEEDFANLEEKMALTDNKNNPIARMETTGSVETAETETIVVSVKSEELVGSEKSGPAVETTESAAVEKIIPGKIPGKEVQPDIEEVHTDVEETKMDENMGAAAIDEDVAETKEQIQFFWKPFNLQSKADGFAAYISSRSNVSCKAEKTGTGKYQVCFSYDDENDRDTKIIMIENTGIKVDLN